MEKGVEGEKEAPATADVAGDLAAPVTEGTTSAAAVLAFQRAAGNAATGRALRGGNGSGAPQVSRAPAPPPREVGAGARSLAAAVEARRVLARQGNPPATATDPAPADKLVRMEWLYAPGGSPSAVARWIKDLMESEKAKVQVFAYLVLDNNIDVFDYTQKHYGTFKLKPDAPGAKAVVTLPSGVYFLENDHYWTRLGRPAGTTQKWTTWTFVDADKDPIRYQVRPWMASDDEWTGLKKAMAGAQQVVMVITGGSNGGTATAAKKGKGKGGDPPPEWADKKVKEARKRVEKARARIASDRATRPPPDADANKDQPKPPEQDPEEKRLPDKVVAWAQDNKAFVNVHADGGVKTLEMREGETDDEFLERVKAAAKELRDDRDPSQSVKVVNAAEKTQIGGAPPQGERPKGLQMLDEGDADPNRPPLEGANKRARYHAYPASIRMSGADPSRPEENVTVIGATNMFRMSLDWSMGGRDNNFLSQVTRAMQWVTYRWELIRVDRGAYKEQATMAHRTQAKKELDEAKNVPTTQDPLKQDAKVTAVGSWSGEGADIARAMNAIGEDSKADLEAHLRSPAMWPMTYQYLTIVALSASVRTLGSLIGAVTSHVATPKEEQRMSFAEEGDFVIRCIATPQARSEDEIRASSVAVLPIRVLKVNERAELASTGNERERKSLEAQLAGAPANAEPNSILDVKEAIDDLKAMDENSVEANARRSIAQIDDQILLAQQYRKYIGGDKLTELGAERERRLWKISKLIENLAASRMDVDTFISNLEKGKAEAIKLRDRIDNYGHKGFLDPKKSYSPRITLSSEESGQVYSLVTTLGQTKSRDKHGVTEWRLADVTSAKSTMDYWGRSKAVDDQTAHREAITAAFKAFAEKNEFGRGTIVVRMPGDLEKDLGFVLGVRTTWRSAPGDHERAMQKLKDVATVAEIAGMVVGGPVGLAIGVVGGAISIGLAAENISKRVQGDRFEWWSFETAMDIFSIAGAAVGVGAGVAGLGRFAGVAGRTGKVLATAEHVFCPLAKGALAGQYVVVPVSSFKEMTEQEKAWAEMDAAHRPTPGEMSIKRAQMMSRLAYGIFTTGVATAQMMGAKPLFGHEEPPPWAHDMPGVGKPVTGQKEPPQLKEAPPVVKDTPPATTKELPPANRVTDPVPGSRAPLPDPAAGGGGVLKPPGGGTTAPPSPPSGGPPKKPTIEFRVVKPQELSMSLDAAHGKFTAGPPELGKITVAPREVLEQVHQELTGTPLPKEAVGMRDPKTGELWLAEGAVPPDRFKQIEGEFAKRIKPLATKSFGESLAAGLNERVLGSLINKKPLGTTHPAETIARDVTDRMLALVGNKPVMDAFYGNDLNGLRLALGEALGSHARANAVESALRAGNDVEALRFMDPPKTALADATGKYLADGAADLAAIRNGGKPQNAERAKAAQVIADKVGADVLENAWLKGDVKPLMDALNNTYGRKRTGRLLDALARSDGADVRRSLDTSVKPPPRRLPPKTSEKGAVKEVAPEAPPAADPHAIPKPDPTTAPNASKLPADGAHKTLAEGLAKGQPKESLLDSAKRFIQQAIDAGGFKAIRKMVLEEGLFGTTDKDIKAAQDAIQNARMEVTNTELNRIKSELEAAYEARGFKIEIQLSDLGTPGFASDRDVTVKARAKGGAEVPPNELIAASVEGVQRAYEALNKLGYPPDKVLDSNFYTELHEGLLPGAGPAERAAISRDQSVISLAEMKRNMTPQQFDANVQALREKIGTPDKFDTSTTAQSQRQAMKEFESQLTDATALSERLGSPKEAEAKLKAKLDELLGALRADPPKSQQEIRRLMGEVKLLEPDAYGTRAAVESVVDFQQALARAESDLAAGPILKSRPGRPGGADAHVTSSEFATAAQAASASQGKLSHSYKTGTDGVTPLGNPPVAASAVSKYLSRVLQAFREAGLHIEHPLIGREGLAVAAKAGGDKAVMAELRAWAERNAIEGSDQQIVDKYVQQAENLARELTARLRAAEQASLAAEGFQTPKEPPPDASGGPKPGDPPPKPGTDPDVILDSALSSVPAPPPAGTPGAAAATARTPLAWARALIARLPKLSRSAATLDALTEIFTRTSSGVGEPEYIPGHTRAHAQELRSIIQACLRPDVVSVELLPGGVLRDASGRLVRTPDIVMEMDNGARVRVEVRTLTGSGSGYKTSHGTPARAVKVDEIVAAIQSKARVTSSRPSQLTSNWPGAPPVGGQLDIHIPFGGTATQAADAMSRLQGWLQTRPHVSAIQFFLADHTSVLYVRDPQTGWYQLATPTPVPARPIPPPVPVP